MTERPFELFCRCDRGWAVVDRLLVRELDVIQLRVDFVRLAVLVYRIRHHFEDINLFGVVLLCKCVLDQVMDIDVEALENSPLHLLRPPSSVVTVQTTRRPDVKAVFPKDFDELETKLVDVLPDLGDVVLGDPKLLGLLLLAHDVSRRKWIIGWSGRLSVGSDGTVLHIGRWWTRKPFQLKHGSRYNGRFTDGD